MKTAGWVLCLIKVVIIIILLTIIMYENLSCRKLKLQGQVTVKR